MVFFKPYAHSDTLSSSPSGSFKTKPNQWLQLNLEKEGGTFNLSYAKLFENPKQFVPTLQQYKGNYIYKSWNIPPVNHFTTVDIIT